MICMAKPNDPAGPDHSPVSEHSDDESSPRRQTLRLSAESPLQGSLELYNHAGQVQHAELLDLSFDGIGFRLRGASPYPGSVWNVNLYLPDCAIHLQFQLCIQYVREDEIGGEVCCGARILHSIPGNQRSLARILAWQQRRLIREFRYRGKLKDPDAS